tara:strand:- start:131 stop:721 length:591 start_codon:yes stop_codon:yes gene_type:complete
MKKITTKKEALNVFELLNIKEVGKKFQHKRGTYVYELPFCTSYHNGTLVPIKFAVYKTGYVRRVEGAFTCYQINKQRQEPDYFKDCKWNYDTKKSEWTGKYRKRYSTKRILIDNHEDRIVYLCNYILKNFYQTNKWSLIGEWTRKGMTQQAKDSHELHKIKNPERYRLPFGDDGGYLNPPKDEIQVIINGHRYNLT